MDKKKRTFNDELMDFFLVPDRRKTCKHEFVPWVKSYHSDQKVQRGYCVLCRTILQEMD